MDTSNLMQVFFLVVCLCVAAFFRYNRTSSDKTLDRRPLSSIPEDDGLAKLMGTIEQVLYGDQKVYLHVRPAYGESFWVYTPELRATPGDSIQFEISVPRTNFRSRELDRNFPEIYYAPYPVVSYGDANLEKDDPKESVALV